MCMLCIINSLAAMHIVHSLHDAAVLRLGTPTPTPAWHASRFASSSMKILHRSELAELKAPPALPFIAVDAVVTGEVWGGLNTDAAAGWAGAARGLLHGKRRPSAYTQCSECTVVQCNKATKVCTGHCKRKKKLFKCRTKYKSKRPCYSADSPDPLNVEADSLESLDSVVVSIAGPYIGCANITGLPSGCPAEGTRGFNEFHSREYTVLSSSCRQHLYDLQCEQPLFYPFGLCSCVIGFEDGNPAHVPCYFPHLNYTAPRLQDTGGVPVRVSSEGNTTVTMYGVREAHDARTLMVDHVFELGVATVHVEMEVWSAHTGRGMDLTLEGPMERDE